MIQAIDEHPSKKQREYSINCLKNGYKIGFTGEWPTSCSKNYPSPCEHKEKITQWLLETESIIGPFTYEQALQAVAPAQRLHVVPAFTLQTSKKIIPITDFSFPKKWISLNSQIEEKLRSVR